MKKRLLSWLLTVAMLMSLVVIPASAIAQDETNSPNSYKAGFNVTDNKDGTLSVQTMAGPNKEVTEMASIKGVMNYILVYDPALLKPLYFDKTEITCGKTPVEEAMSDEDLAYRDPKTKQKWVTKAYPYESEDGKTGIIIIQPACGKASELTTDVALCTVYLGLQEGKTIDDLTTQSVRFATWEEAKETFEIYPLKIGNNDANGGVIHQWANGGESDPECKETFTGPDPETVATNFTPKVPPLPLPVCVAPTGVTAEYGDTLADVTLTNAVGNTPGTWTWQDASASVGALGAHTFKADFTPAAPDKFQAVKGIDVTVTVGPKTLTDVSVSDIAKVEYTGSQIKPAVTVIGGGKTLAEDVDYTVEYGANLNVGTGTVTVKAKAGGNYAFTDVTKSFDIVVAPSTITITGELDKVYDGEAVDMTGKYTVEGSDAVPVVEYYTDTDGSMDEKLSAAPVDAGTYWVNVYVSGNGNFSPSDASERFTISPRSIEDAVVEITDDLVYNGENQSVKLTKLSVDGKLLGSGDYMLADKDQKNAGTYELVIQGSNNYTGKLRVKWHIAPLTISVKADPVDREYDGTLVVGLTNTMVTPSLIMGDDITVEMNAKMETPDAGKNKPVSISLALVGPDASNYALASASLTGYVDIAPKKLTDVTVAPIGDQTYTGSQIKPDVTVNSAVALVKDTDYTVTYGANLNKGPASVTVAPKTGGNYTFAPVTVNFNIVAQASTVTINGELDKVYDGKAVDMAGKYTVEGSSGKVTVAYETEGGTALTEAPKDAGTYRVTVSVAADANFGSATDQKEFTISPKSIEGAVVTIDDDRIYNTMLQTAKLDSVKLGELTLTAADYDVTDNQQKNAGTYTLTVTGKGNYTGAVTAEWHIAQAVINPVHVDLLSRDYNGTTDVAVTGVSCAPGYDINDDVEVNGTAVLPSPDAGTYTVTVNLSLAGADAGNYKLTSTTIEGSCTVNPAYHADQSVSTSVVADQAASVSVDLSGQIDGIKGAALAAPYESEDAHNLISNAALAGNAVTFDVAKVPGAGKTAQLTVEVSSTNYKDFKIYVNITSTDKLDAEISVEPIGTQYTYGDEAIPVRASAKGDEGIWAISSSDPAVLKIVDTADGPVAEILKSGTASITITYDSPTTYGTVTLPAITVEKAELVIKALDKTIDLDEKAPDLSAPVLDQDYTVTGLVGKDAVTGVTLAYNATPDTTKEGTYQIEIKGFTADPEKYDVTLVPGTLTVEEPYYGGGGVLVRYPITVEKAEYGEVAVSDAKAAAGDTVAITVKADADAKLEELIVTDKNGKEIEVKANGEKYVFTMPASAVTVTAVFATEHEWVNPFIDVHESDYFYDAVKWGVINGVTYGTSANTYSPDADCTRAQIVTFLWRVAGAPAPKTTVNPFTDVAEDAWYYDAVLWAVENGVTFGTSDTTFSPDLACTRSQAVALLYRYQGSPKAEAEMKFTDVVESDYFYDAVEWAVANGVTYGTSETTYSPLMGCTRGQIICFVYRIVNK